MHINRIGSDVVGERVRCASSSLCCDCLYILEPPRLENQHAENYGENLELAMMTRLRLLFGANTRSRS